MFLRWTLIVITRSATSSMAQEEPEK